MRLLVGVTGRAGAGKSTFLEAANQLSDVHAVYPGRECRAKWGKKAFIAASSPTAPDFSEAFVREIVDEAAVHAETIVLVDGVPRRRDQCPFLAETAEKHARFPVVLILDAPAGVLSLRMGRRGGDVNARTLDVRRHVTDSTLAEVIIDASRQAGILALRVSNAAPGLDAFQGRAADLVAGMLDDAAVDDRTLSVFCALAGVL